MLNNLDDIEWAQAKLSMAANQDGFYIMFRNRQMPVSVCFTGESFFVFKVCSK